MPARCCIKWFKSLKLTNRVFVSPDVGNVKRAQVYANMLGGEICIIDKRRKSGIGDQGRAHHRRRARARTC